MAEKIITKSFERLLDKGKHRGFITYEELNKSLGKRNLSDENLEKAYGLSGFSLVNFSAKSLFFEPYTDAEEAYISLIFFD